MKKLLIIVIIVAALLLPMLAGSFDWFDVFRDPSQPPQPEAGGNGGPVGDGFISAPGNYFISSAGNYFTSN